MMTNMDIDECLVRAELSVTENIQSALEEFYRPDVEMEAATLWTGMEDRLKQLIRQRSPEAAKRLDEIVKGR